VAHRHSERMDDREVTSRVLGFRYRSIHPPEQ